MGRNNKDFHEGKDHIVSWTGKFGDTFEQRFPTSKLAEGVDPQKAVGKHLAKYANTTSPRWTNEHNDVLEGPAKGTKVKWKAVDPE
jgi:hypothetical protein